MIRYLLPGFTAHLKFNLIIAGMKKTTPELFYDDITFDSMYGNFPGCIMNGGRRTIGERYTYDQIADTFDRIENEGLGICLTFTNTLVKPEHFEDEYSNTILRAAQGRNARAIVYSDELGDYISGRYHLKLVLSTSRPLKDADELNTMLDRYDMVVLDYNHNKDDEFLKQIRDPARLEVMPNELCRPNCPTRQIHYECESYSQMNSIQPFFFCPQKCASSGFTMQTDSSPHLLSNSDIRRLNTVYGISYFKIVGRLLAKGLLMESYAYYFAKSEYRSVLMKIMKSKIDQ